MKLRSWALPQVVYSGAVEDGGAPSAAPSPGADAGAGGGGGSEAVATPASNADRMGLEPKIEEIFNFDPFEAEQAPAPAPAAEAAPVAEVAPPAPSTPPPPAPQAELAQVVQDLRQTVQELPRAMAPPPQPQSAPQEDAWIPRDGERALNYVDVMGQVPEAVYAGIRSENPAEQKAAVSQLMGIGMHVAHRLATKQAVEQVRREMSQILPQFVNEQLRTYDTMQRVYQDFYGKFPALSAPHFRGIVQQEAVKLSQQLGVSGWTPEFRDRLGEHVIGVLRGAVPQAVVPQAAPATQAMGATARPVMANGSRDPSQEMAELLGF